MTNLAATKIGWAVLLLLFVSGSGGCAARRPAVQVVPRKCITAIELTERTECTGKADMLHCSNLKLTYSCTEVRRDERH